MALVGQLLVESLLLALMGAALGLRLRPLRDQGLVRACRTALIPHETVIRLNLPVLLFSVGVAVLTPRPVRPCARPGRPARASWSRSRTPARARGWAPGAGGCLNTLVDRRGRALLVLLAGAGLLMRSFIKLQTVNLGFDPERVLVAAAPCPAGRTRRRRRSSSSSSPFFARLQSQPGVVAATATTTLPPYGGIGSEIEIPGQDPTGDAGTRSSSSCSEGYFDHPGPPAPCAGGG